MPSFLRYRRFATHCRGLFRPTAGTLPAPYPTHWPWRLMESILLLADCLGVPEILLWLNRTCKPGTRPLYARERALAETVFEKNLPYDRIWIDERSHIGCRHYRFAYVGFTCINSWGALRDPHFIHELVHIWQYEQVGSAYIPRALHAQRSKAGYHYGGPEALQAALEAGKDLRHFNYEQQGDIVADYFCLLHGYTPLYCPADRRYLSLFQAVIAPVLWGQTPKSLPISN